jgi:predicted ribosome quality control (RQC) complex YloA/Tae2 family protein
MSSSDQFRKYETQDGLLIQCGRNNIQNDLLTMKTAAPEDLWFHVQKMPGTHVVLRCGKSEPSESSILQAARTAAFFSRTWSRSEKHRASDPRQTKNENQDLSELKIAVDYCPVKNVRKPSKAKPGMVIYDHYKTVLVSPVDPAKPL